MKKPSNADIHRMPIFHLTMNTGHITMQEPQAAGALALNVLKPLVKKGTAQVPCFPDWNFRIIPSTSTWRYFEISNIENGAAILGVIAWDADSSLEAWEFIERKYLSASDNMAESSFPESILNYNESPAGVPWLAVMLTEAAFFANPIDLFWLGDFEHCLARTVLLVESESISQ